MYDLSFLEKQGINTAEFIRCNNKLLQLQRDFLEDLLSFAEECGARGVELEVNDFLIATLRGLLEYAVFIVTESKGGEE